MVKNKYSGEFDIVLQREHGETVMTEKKFSGLIKISPTIHLDSDKISAYFIQSLGGGYVEGEKYRYSITLEDSARAIVTTLASTKVYKCSNGKQTEQDAVISLKGSSILEYVTDSVILYKDALYKQVNDIYMDEDSTLIYSDGITSGWSKDGREFQYSGANMKTRVYVGGKIVLLDNLFINPKENDVTKLGYFEGYSSYGTLLVIKKDIDAADIESMRLELKKLNKDIAFGISELEVSGFILRVMGKLTQDVNEALAICHNYVRKKFLGSKELNIRKY